MALSATTQWEVRNGGSDTVCGGGFDPGQTAGMFTDGAATVANTTAPSFGSASYSFIAGDVNAYVFIGAGTNWTKGWYKITAVDSGKAILSATAGAYQAYGDGSNTADGCASVASPTGATWSIDYSQQDAAQISFTDVVTYVGSQANDITSAAHPFGKQMVGNAIYFDYPSVNLTIGLYVIASVSGTTATVIGAANLATGADTGVTGYLGGGFASLGRAGQFAVASNPIWAKYNASLFSLASTSSNIATGRLTAVAGAGATPGGVRGYGTVRGVVPTNRPTFQWGLDTGPSLMITGAASYSVEDVILDGNVPTRANVRGISCGTGMILRNTKVQNFDSLPISVAGGIQVIRCEFSGNTGVSAMSSNQGMQFVDSYFHDNTSNFQLTITTGCATFKNCIFDTNAKPMVSCTGLSMVRFENCVFYNTTGPGVEFTAAPYYAVFINCIFMENTTYGISCAAQYGGVKTINCAYYNNGTAKYLNGPLQRNNIGEIVLTASPFMDAPNGDFRLNNGAGRQLKTAGYPSTMPGLTWTNYAEVGAAGSRAGGNGGGGYFAPF